MYVCWLVNFTFSLSVLFGFYFLSYVHGNIIFSTTWWDVYWCMLFSVYKNKLEKYKKKRIDDCGIQTNFSHTLIGLSLHCENEEKSRLTIKRVWNIKRVNFGLPIYLHFVLYLDCKLPLFSIHSYDMSSSPSHSATKIHANNGADGPQLQGNGDNDKEMSKYLMEPQDRPLIIRTSRAFRHFKNPPQPHMCIRDHTVDGEELFINVMSWTRIVMPQNADDPIPLYGGMKVCFGEGYFDIDSKLNKSNFLRFYRAVHVLLL